MKIENKVVFKGICIEGEIHNAVLSLELLTDERKEKVERVYVSPHKLNLLIEELEAVKGILREIERQGEKKKEVVHREKKPVMPVQFLERPSKDHPLKQIVNKEKMQLFFAGEDGATPVYAYSKKSDMPFPVTTISLDFLTSSIQFGTGDALYERACTVGEIVKAFDSTNTLQKVVVVGYQSLQTCKVLDLLRKDGKIFLVLDESSFTTN